MSTVPRTHDRRISVKYLIFTQVTIVPNCIYVYNAYILYINY